MALLSLPDILGMLILMGVLAWLREKYHDKTVNLWMIGLTFVLLEAIAVGTYRGSQWFHQGTHILALDCNLFAAVAFGWTARRDLLPGESHLPFFVLPAVPLLLQTTAYGLEVHALLPYIVIALLSLVAGAVYIAFFSSGSLTFRATLLTIHLFTWGPISFLAFHNHLRGLVYWGLGCIYLLVALAFRGRARQRSIGGVVIVAGFLIWAICFFLHPIARGHIAYDSVLEQIWNMQKFFVIIGMLLVLLEEQTSLRAEEAMHDPLTGLPNRRLFADRLAQAVERSRRSGLSMALFMIDLDNFKEINDTLGHHTGDLVLESVAQRLQSRVRTSDTLARFGGDEFSVIVNDLGDPQDCEAIALVLCEALKSVSLSRDPEIALTGSVGYALFPRDAFSADALLEIADRHMYEKKRGVRMTAFQETNDERLTQALADRPAKSRLRA